MLPCPFLPRPERAFTHVDLHALGSDRGKTFYDTALRYAQSLWLGGYPAKTLLLISRALSCNLADVSLQGDGKPYHAVAWVLRNRPADRFMGNPRRHYQHLATRMVEPHKELRAWRAWACWYLSKQVLDESEFPPDLRQVREELVIKPRREEIAQELSRLSPSDDREAWESAISWATPGAGAPTGEVAMVPVSLDVTDVAEISRLAHIIWPKVYPPVISMEQIDYMLGQSYSPDALREDMMTRDVSYALIREGTENIGYLAWSIVPEEDSAFLHKLYLLPDRHGRGIGARALAWVEDAARSRGASRLRLRVNRRNSRAIRAYVRSGFSFESEVCTDIGRGFVMDDYIMSKPLTSA